MPNAPDPSATFPHDRRARPRFVPLTGVTVDCRTNADPGPNVALSLLDISATGARLYLSPPVRSGAGVAVVLSPPDEGDDIPRAATVVWVHTDHGIACTAGVEFDVEVRADDLARLTGLWEPG